MINNPKYVKIKDKLYKLNTSYKVALECDKIAKDVNIDDMERALAIIYKLYGNEGINSYEDYEELILKGRKYLLLGKEIKSLENDFEGNEPDMDYEQDWDLIKASFMSDYNIDLEEKDLHWWTFFNLLNGLSNSEFGNCCVLNRVRNLRNFDLTQIKDGREREKIRKAKEKVKLVKKEIIKEYTDKEKESINKFYEQMGIERKEEKWTAG